MESKSPPAMDAETKAAYFAQYFGQDVFASDPTTVSGYRIAGHTLDYVQHPAQHKTASWVILKPLSSITHTQVIQMCFAADRMPFSGRNNESKWIVDIKERGFAKVTCSKNIYSFMVDLVDGEVDVYMEGELITSANNRAVADYLRKEGFAIGFRQFDVEGLVSCGVLKLREVENTPNDNK